MQSNIINKSPAEWLRDIGEPSAKIAEVLASFAGASVRVCSYRPEHRFLRFHGANSARRIYQPNYWADGSVLGAIIGRAAQFEDWLTDAEIGRIAKNYYRDLAAICHNWNPLKDNELWKIDLRDGETVEGLEGPAAPQPTFSAVLGATASKSIFRGGATQVYLNPRTPFLCTPLNWNAI